MKNLRFKQWIKLNNNKFAPIEFLEHGKSYRIMEENTIECSINELVEKFLDISVIWNIDHGTKKIIDKCFSR